MSIITEVAELDDVIDLPISMDIENRAEAVLWMFMLGSMDASPDAEARADYFSMHWPSACAAFGLFHGADLARQFRDSLDSQSITDLRWRQIFVDHCAVIPYVGRRILIARLTMQCIAEMDDDPFAGTVVRRMDALYDLAGIPFTFTEIQSQFLEVVAELSHAQVSPRMKTGAGIAAGALGFIGGLHGVPIAGTWANKGVEWLLEQFRTVDNSVRVAAELVVIASVMATDADDNDWLLVMQVASYFEELAMEESRNTGTHKSGGTEDSTHVAAHEARARVARHACDLVNALSDDTDESRREFEQEVPQVRGMSLSDARTILARLGCHVIEVNPGDRIVFNAANWKVLNQSHTSTDGQVIVRLWIDKFVA